MRFLRRFGFGLRALFRRGAMQDELDEELRVHLEMLTEDNMAQGMSSRAARRAAVIEFGGIERAKEDCRDSWGMQFVFGLYRDFRYAMRILLKSYGFTSLAIGSLALGIGVNIAVFTLANGIFLKHLSVENPGALRIVQWTGQNAKVSEYSGFVESSNGSWGSYDTGSFSSDDGSWVTCESFTGVQYRSMREAAGDLAEVFGYAGLSEVTARAEAGPFPIEGLVVSDNFFEGIDVRPYLGRTLGARLAPEEAGAAVLISYRLWEREYAADPGVIGRALTLNKKPYSIVGVLPPGFNGVSNGGAVDFYVTPVGSEFLLPGRSFESDNRWWIRVMARVRKGVSDELLQARLATAFSVGLDKTMEHPGLVVKEGGAGADPMRRVYRKPLALLLGVVGIVALVTCANLAGLCLSRGVARQHEFAIRAALGARPFVLGRQSLLENALLALGGGTLGIVLAIWIRKVILFLVPLPVEGLRYDFSFDLRVLGFALGLVVATSLLSGIFPALRAGRVDPLAGLSSRSSMSASRLRSGRVLVVAQMVLSVVLLAVGGLFVRSFLKVSHVDSGFSEENILLASLNLRTAGLEGDDITLFWEQAVERVKAIPGIDEVGISDFAMLGGSMSGGSFFRLPGRSESANEDVPNAHRLIIDEKYLAVMDIPLLRGRGLWRSDVKESRGVVLVNETFARTYFPEKGALGQLIVMGEETFEIVGVCGDVHYTDLRGDVPSTVYFSFRQWPWGLSSGYFSIRTSVEPMSLVEPLKRAISSLNADLPVTSVETQEAVRDRSLKPERMLAIMVGSLGGLALLLSCLGIFGLMAYNVRRRFAEIGVRMALGAMPNVVARSILKEAVVMGLFGVALGVPLAYLLSGLVEELLSAASTVDPYAYTSSVFILLFVAWIAAWIPARRASLVDPMSALRAE